ncbi:hypothetical protein C8J57DRAFT_1239221 [Mycena rebaudengoi]|nr:hypothetical protein C8J57DRAFT_1239221 [Mycena rebaudengoi]
MPTDQDWLVDEIVKHKWTGPRTIKFWVKWIAGDHTWEPLSHVKELQVLDDYLDAQAPQGTGPTGSSALHSNSNMTIGWNAGVAHGPQTEHPLIPMDMTDVAHLPTITTTVRRLPRDMRRTSAHSAHHRQPDNEHHHSAHHPLNEPRQRSSGNPHRPLVGLPFTAHPTAVRIWGPPTVTVIAARPLDSQQSHSVTGPATTASALAPYPTRIRLPAMLRAARFRRPSLQMMKRAITADWKMTLIRDICAQRSAILGKGTFPPCVRHHRGQEGSPTTTKHPPNTLNIVCTGPFVLGPASHYGFSSRNMASILATWTRPGCWLQRATPHPSHNTAPGPAISSDTSKNTALAHLDLRGHLIPHMLSTRTCPCYKDHYQHAPTLNHVPFTYHIWEAHRYPDRADNIFGGAPTRGSYMGPATDLNEVVDSVAQQPSTSWHQGIRKAEGEWPRLQHETPMVPSQLTNPAPPSNIETTTITPLHDTPMPDVAISPVTTEDTAATISDVAHDVPPPAPLVLTDEGIMSDGPPSKFVHVPNYYGGNNNAHVQHKRYV